MPELRLSWSWRRRARRLLFAKYKLGLIVVTSDGAVARYESQAVVPVHGGRMLTGLHGGDCRAAMQQRRDQDHRREGPRPRP